MNFLFHHNNIGFVITNELDLHKATIVIVNNQTGKKAPVKCYIFLHMIEKTNSITGTNTKNHKTMEHIALQNVYLTVQVLLQWSLALEHMKVVKIHYLLVWFICLSTGLPSTLPTTISLVETYNLILTIVWNSVHNLTLIQCKQTVSIPIFAIAISDNFQFLLFPWNLSLLLSCCWFLRKNRWKYGKEKRIIYCSKCWHFYWPSEWRETASLLVFNTANNVILHLYIYKCVCAMCSGNKSYE